jgi:hypothetical protein
MTISTVLLRTVTVSQCQRLVLSFTVEVFLH